MSLRWGLLSTANINRALLDSGHGGIVAVASRSADRAEAYARENGIERAHGSYEDLLADPEVDAIYNPLPNSMHVEWSIRALEAGKHVLCEKPLSRRPADVDRVFDVAEREGRIVAEAFMYRHNPQIARAREIVASGAIGPLRVLRACFSYAHPDPSDIRLSADLDGGGLMDVGCYCVHGTRALAGAEPERVYAEQVIGGEGVDVRLVGTLRFPGGVLAAIDCGVSYAAHDELEAIGEDGSVFLDDPWHGRDTVVEVRRPGEPTERIEVPWASSYALEMEDLEAAARGEREPLLGRADALAQACTIAALYRSADEGRPVDPASET
jgi:D-xylose 1-dehydrogenase (NADP+, D-xylono-1,5-lactone-forming)